MAVKIIEVGVHALAITQPTGLAFFLLSPLPGVAETRLERNTTISKGAEEKCSKSQLPLAGTRSK